MQTIAIGIFCKTPAPGHSKTRLSPPLRPDECAAISACFIRDLTATIADVARAGEHGLPGESVVEEEAEVTEAIHAAAHPGRTSKADADDTDAAASATDASASTERGDASASDDDASGDEQADSEEAVS